MGESRWRRQDVLPIFLAVTLLMCGYLYGWFTSRVPGVASPSEIWVPNLSAPYVLVPFLVAWLMPVRWWGRIISAVISEHVMFAGFYALLSMRTGGDWYTPLLTFSLHGWGPYILLLGATCGGAAVAAHAHRSILLVLASVPCLESIALGTNVKSLIPAMPNLWASRLDALTYDRHNLIILGAEFAVGVALLVATRSMMSNLKNAPPPTRTP